MHRTSSRVLLIVAVFVLFLVPVAAVANSSLFTDVPENSTFVDDINWMKTAGVTNGCGDGTTYCPGDNVTRGQMAAFMHRLANNRVVDAGTVGGMTAAELKGQIPAATAATGGSQAQNNIQPSLALNCIIALTGLFPSRDGAGTTSPFLGEVKWFAGNFAPAGWAFCDGQILQISQNSALFAILGTTYGGNGTTSFALPDARGRSIVHEGNGPSLTSRQLGSNFGTETETQSVPQMPSHTHTITP